MGRENQPQKKQRSPRFLQRQQLTARDLEYMLGAFKTVRARKSSGKNQTKRGMFPSSEGLDIGYKVFSLKKKPQIEDEELVIQNERQSTLDTLFNMLSTTGKTLDTPIQEIQKRCFI